MLTPAAMRLDPLSLAELAGLVGQHHIDRLAYLMQVVGQGLIN